MDLDLNFNIVNAKSFTSLTSENYSSVKFMFLTRVNMQLLLKQVLMEEVMLNSIKFV